MLRTTGNEHFVLFFDVNDTTFIGDTAKDVGKELSILKLLGEKYSQVWDESITKEEMSYRDYVDNYVVPGNKRDSQVQGKRNQEYTRLFDVLRDTNHPRLNEIEEKYRAICDSLKDGYIPRSFIRFIEYLDLKKHQYTIVFRTFGKDINLLGEELSRRTSIHELDQAKFVNSELILDNGHTIKTPRDILDHIKPLKHAVWQDNFAEWHTAGESYESAKMFPVDFWNKEHISIFFDDNISKKIVNAIPVTNGASEKHPDQVFFQRSLANAGRIVAVDTLDVCTDDDYFISKFEYACTQELALSKCYPNYASSTATLFGSRKINNNTTPQSIEESPSLNTNAI